MFGFRLACLLVKYLSITSHGRSVALLFDPGTGNVQAWSRDTRAQPHDVGTAGVNLQRGYARKVDGHVMLTSSAPLVIDLGMAKLTGLKHVVHFDGTATARYAPGNSNVAQGPYDDPGTFPDELRAWGEHCEKLLKEGRTRDFANAFANVPAKGIWPQRIQDFITGGDVMPDFPSPPEPPAQDGLAVEGRVPEVDAFWMMVARRLAGLVHIGANKAGGERHGHNIACVLVDLNNRILAWGVNTLNNHPTRHAETKCIWMFQNRFPGKLVPEGATLYTTLQSCYMCSATIKHACGDNNVRVVYGEADKVGGKSVLASGGGAREIRLKSLLKGTRRTLLAGKMLLARGRWDRLRRAFQARLDLPPEQRAGALTDQAGLRAFMQNIGGKLTRETLEERLGGADRDPAYTAAVTAATNAIRAQVRSGQLKISGKELGQHIGQEKGRLLDNFKIPLQQARADNLRIEQDAARLAYSGGAPVLLQNPVAIEPLYDMPQIQRRGLVSSDVRVRDLTTQIHALDLLLQVIKLVPEYKLH